MLKCEGLVKKYASTNAVKDITVDILPGKIYALLGPNGSGKTTFMKIVTGLVQPTGGSVKLDEVPVGEVTKNFVAYMPTENYFYSYMNAKHIGAFYKDFYDDFQMDVYNQLLKELDLPTNVPAKNMSTGMVAKLKVAVAMSRHASIILLDEPLNGIDMIARDTILNTIIAHKRPDSAMVISSHLVDDLEKVIDDAIFISEGSVIEHGTADDLRSKYDKSIVDIYKFIYTGGTYND